MSHPGAATVAASTDGFAGWSRPPGPPLRLPAFDGRAVLDFHRRLPGYQPTPLVDCAPLARQLGVRKVWLKLESERLGLPSFKILGASWAVYRAIGGDVGRLGPWRTVDDLARVLPIERPFTLLAATDGNHGRAVARMAAMLDLASWIFVPGGTADARIAAIQAEGATVTVVDGDYDATVRRAASEADEQSVVISDTSWPGYGTIPGWVAEGYETIFTEVDDQLEQVGEEPPSTVAIPVGVGALASAAIRHFRSSSRADHPRLVSVEPFDAACVLHSLRAGHPVVIAGPHPSIMAGLNCGTPSLIAWSLVQPGLDVAVAVGDGAAARGMRLLAEQGVEVGETGAAALAGMLELRERPGTEDLRRAAALSSDASVLLLATEGVTDPQSFEAIVGRQMAHAQPGSSTLLRQT